VTHTADDVIDELLDVAVTALGSVEHLTGNAGASLGLLVFKVNQVKERLGGGGQAAGKSEPHRVSLRVESGSRERLDPLAATTSSEVGP
jgi:hypothetical protein